MIDDEGEIDDGINYQQVIFVVVNDDLWWGEKRGGTNALANIVLLQKHGDGGGTLMRFK